MHIHEKTIQKKKELEAKWIIIAERIRLFRFSAAKFL